MPYYGKGQGPFVHGGRQYDIRILLHLDRDRIGSSMSEALSWALGDDYQIRDEPPKFGKDMNDELMHMRQKMVTPCSPVV